MAKMNYRKFRADHLFTGDNWLNDNYVLITDQAGCVQEIVPLTEAGDDIEVFEGILTPGFVNCHCHLELSHMKGVIPEGTGMVDFLVSVIKGRQFAPEVIASAIAAAETEMLDNGIVAVGDICNTADTVAQKRLGRMAYYNFIEAIGFMDATAQQRFEAARDVYEQFAGLRSIVPHAPYSVSEKLFGLIAGFDVNQLISIHNQESEAEREFMKMGKGDFLRLYEALGMDVSFYTGSSRRSWEWFAPGQPVMLVHNCVTDEADLWALDRRPVHFCLCPNANLYIGNPLPDVELLRKFPIVLGTDSLASNWQLNILSEMQTLRKHFPDISLKELLQWGTLNGAKALNLDVKLGSFAVGKKPGVLVVDELLTQVNRLL